MRRSTRNRRPPTRLVVVMTDDERYETVQVELKQESEEGTVETYRVVSSSDDEMGCYKADASRASQLQATVDGMEPATRCEEEAAAF